jgi:Domain of unknown function (DUF4442)
MTSPTSTYAAWQRLSGRPGGSRLFSIAAMARVPYFASVLPHVVRMEPGLAEVQVFAQITAGVELVVPVTVTDRNGTEVVHADITTWVTPA